jgi:branched-chain amino acid aminotransferase
LQDFVLHPATMALHYGQALFEGMKAAKTRDGQPVLFRPEMHAQRLNASARRLCMPELPEDLFIEAVQRLVALDANWIPQQEESALYIRPGMFATDAFVGVRPSKSYCFYIINSPVGPYYSHPVRLCAETHYVRAIRGGVGEAKVAGNYAAALLPTQIAQEKGFDQVMWLDGLNFEYIQEVGTMNIFFVIDGKVVTPETDGAILKGITRDSIIHLLQDHGYEVEVRPLSIHEVVEAYQAGKLQECFGSGTAAVVSHVSEIAYGDLLMHLPPIESRKVGDFAKAEINGIRSGLLPDPYGWVVPVETPVPAG